VLLKFKMPIHLEVSCKELGDAGNSRSVSYQRELPMGRSSIWELKKQEDHVEQTYKEWEIASFKKDGMLGLGSSPSPGVGQQNLLPETEMKELHNTYKAGFNPAFDGF
jgi:hypothetical protein